MGIKGRQWAWENDKWPSVEYFLKKQKKWDTWGLGIFLFWVIVGILIILLKATK
jgi:hypothetical protein